MFHERRGLLGCPFQSLSPAVCVATANVGTAISGSKWRGRKYAFASAVGSPALPITAATKCEYFDFLVIAVSGKTTNPTNPPPNHK